MSGSKGNVNWSQRDLVRWAVGWLPLLEAMCPGQEGFYPRGRPKPASLPLCPASAPDSLPLDTMVSVFLVLPLILFFKG